MNQNHSTLEVIGGLAVGLVIGAALMYYLDPEGGHRRRALVRDQAVHLGHEVGDVAEAARSKAEHVKNRAKGMAHETKSAVKEHLPASGAEGTTEPAGHSQPA